MHSRSHLHPGRVDMRVLAGNEDAHLDAPRLLDLLSEKLAGGRGKQGAWTTGYRSCNAFATRGLYSGPLHYSSENMGTLEFNPRLCNTVTISEDQGQTEYEYALSYGLSNWSQRLFDLRLEAWHSLMCCNVLMSNIGMIRELHMLAVMAHRIPVVNLAKLPHWYVVWTLKGDGATIDHQLQRCCSAGRIVDCSVITNLQSIIYR